MNRSQIDQLEEIFMKALDMELVEDVQLKKDYIIVKLHESKRPIKTLHELADHIRKNYPEVKYFHFNRSTLELQIYHFRWLKHTTKSKDDEETP